MATEHIPESHLTSVTFNVGRQLTVFVPTLYRYMEDQYVDAFLKEGRLRLSSFKAFRRHKDEQRGDPDEGQTLLLMNDVESDRSFGVVSLSGDNAYVLSMSTLGQLGGFGNASFEIFDPVNFCAQVASEIVGMGPMMLGQCIYVDNRILRTGGTPPSVDDLKDDSDSTKISLEKIMAQQRAMSGPKEYFLKERRYEEQSEYRMLWATDRPSAEFLDIVLPQRLRYCRKRENPA